MKAKQGRKKANSSNSHTAGKGAPARNLIDPTTCLEAALERARQQIKRLAEEQNKEIRAAALAEAENDSLAREEARQKQESQAAEFAEAKRDLLAREKAHQKQFSIVLARAIRRFVYQSWIVERTSDEDVDLFCSAWKQIMNRRTMTRAALRYGLPGRFSEEVILQAMHAKDEEAMRAKDKEVMHAKDEEATRAKEEYFYRLIVFWAAEECDYIVRHNEAIRRISKEDANGGYSQRLSRRTCQDWTRRKTLVDAPAEIAAGDWKTDVLRADMELLFPSAESGLFQRGCTLTGREDESYLIPRLRTKQSPSSKVDRMLLTDEALTLLARIAHDDPTGVKALEDYVIWSREMQIRKERYGAAHSSQSPVLATGT